MITVIPISSFMLFKFAKPGLYPHEYAAKGSPSNQFIHSPTIDFRHMVLVCSRDGKYRFFTVEFDNVSPRYDV